MFLWIQWCAGLKHAFFSFLKNWASLLAIAAVAMRVNKVGPKELVNHLNLLTAEFIRRGLKEFKCMYFCQIYRQNIY